MINALLIEDNERDREILKQLLSRYFAGEIVICGTVGTVKEGIDCFQQEKPDLVFLDIELGKESGFDFLTHFTEYTFKVIFVTGHEHYALRAIKFNALDYLLKPLDPIELVNAVNKIRLQNNILNQELKNLLHVLSHPWNNTNKIAIPVINGYKMVTVRDIEYCEANKEYTHIYFADNKTICSSINIGEYESILTGYGFCRVHHSYLVNRNAVIEYQRGEGGELLIPGNRFIPVSRRKKTEVINWLLQKS